MVEQQIRARDVTDPRVLAAMRLVPRHRFVRPADQDRAYSDHALPIAAGQTISQPYIVGVMTQALALRGTDLVLEIGTGSGYQCAVLACLAAEVHTVERLPALSAAAGALVAGLHYDNVVCHVGDGSTGLPELAPFDAILVTAGAPKPPPNLLAQLHPDGGTLVAPVGQQTLQHIVPVKRHGTEFETERLLPCRFVPLLGEHGWSSSPEAL